MLTLCVFFYELAFNKIIGLSDDRSHTYPVINRNWEYLMLFQTRAMHAIACTDTCSVVVKQGYCFIISNVHRVHITPAHD